MAGLARATARRTDGRRSALISEGVDRLLHRVAMPPPYAVPAEVAELHAAIPVVDLVVGTALFRRTFLEGGTHGHVDLPRLREAGVSVVGLTIATRHPNLRGTLSGPHFRSLGIPVGKSTNMDIVGRFVERVSSWAADSAGGLELRRDGPLHRGAGAKAQEAIRAFIGVQGGHAFDGDLRNVERLRALGVRMLAPAHVMDNELVGSSTGARRGGLTGLGREAIGELERVGIVVDLAHMSVAGMRDSLALLKRPFVVSHTGFTELAGASSRWRRYSAAARNLPRELVRDVAAAGGVVGVSVATQLVGGRDVAAVARSVEYACEVAGPDHVAIGSDFDGALETVFDVTGLPLLTATLLARGVGRDRTAAILGGNALRVLSQTGTQRRAAGAGF